MESAAPKTPSVPFPKLLPNQGFPKNKRSSAVFIARDKTGSPQLQFFGCFTATFTSPCHASSAQAESALFTKTHAFESRAQHTRAPQPLKLGIRCRLLHLCSSHRRRSTRCSPAPGRCGQPTNQPSPEPARTVPQRVQREPRAAPVTAPRSRRPARTGRARLRPGAAAPAGAATAPPPPRGLLAGPTGRLQTHTRAPTATRDPALRPSRPAPQSPGPPRSRTRAAPGAHSQGPVRPPNLTHTLPHVQKTHCRCPCNRDWHRGRSPTQQPAPAAPRPRDPGPPGPLDPRDPPPRTSGRARHRPALPPPPLPAAPPLSKGPAPAPPAGLHYSPPEGRRPYLNPCSLSPAPLPAADARYGRKTSEFPR